MGVTSPLTQNAADGGWQDANFGGDLLARPALAAQPFDHFDNRCERRRSRCGRAERSRSLRPLLASQDFVREIGLMGCKSGLRNRPISAIRLEPKNAAAYSFRGTAYSVKGEFDRAIADFDEALRLEPDNVTARKGRDLAQKEKSTRKK